MRSIHFEIVLQNKEQFMEGEYLRKAFYIHRLNAFVGESMRSYAQFASVFCLIHQRKGATTGHHQMHIIRWLNDLREAVTLLWRSCYECINNCMPIYRVVVASHKIAVDVRYESGVPNKVVSFASLVWI